jgi:two-component system, OmpR family, phosphate regulon sensor histidine kinase PhoR
MRLARRIVALAIGLTAPSAVVLLALVFLGFLEPLPGVIALGSVLVLVGLIAAPFAAAFGTLRDAFFALEADASAPIEQLRDIPRGPNPAGTLLHSLVRQTRIWRERIIGAEARLAAAEAVIAAAPDPLILIDRQRRVVGASAAAAEFVGPGGEPRDLAASLRNPALLAAADAVLQGEPGRSVEFALSGPTERVLRAHLARLDGPARGGAAAILALYDVTELKRSEQMRADFIANAGHELKTPLATLIGFIETLLGPARDDPAARQRFLGIMHEQAQRMARLVDDLLSLSRIELNEHVAPTGRVALAPVVEEVARGLELRAAERGIRIARAVPADLPEVLGDRDELAQIFQNLLDNAVKYARPQSEIAIVGDIGAGVAAGQVRIAVSDEGEGIPAEHLPRLTERFYRVDTARSRELGGTGLGLAIVKHIVSRHRGRLEIASTLGQGSTFTVWLREAEPAPPVPVIEP